jgi:hypothetical protein
VAARCYPIYSSTPRDSASSRMPCPHIVPTRYNDNNSTTTTTSTNNTAAVHSERAFLVKRVYTCLTDHSSQSPQRARRFAAWPCLSSYMQLLVIVPTSYNTLDACVWYRLSCVSFTCSLSTVMAFREAQIQQADINPRNVYTLSMLMIKCHVVERVVGCV